VEFFYPGMVRKNGAKIFSLSLITHKAYFPMPSPSLYYFQLYKSCCEAFPPRLPCPRTHLCANLFSSSFPIWLSKRK
jgi:hypothetical protein